MMSFFSIKKKKLKAGPPRGIIAVPVVVGHFAAKRLALA
jgi:hypothetical protein